MFLGGDLLPRLALSAIQFGHEDFVHDYLVPAFTRTRAALGVHYPDIFVILGNDDPRRCEGDFVAAAADGLWHYVHQQKSLLGDFAVYGLAYVPPTPFLLKDWERYDVSRYVPPGCVSPEEGSRTVPTEESEIKWATIQKYLASLVGEDPLDQAIIPPHTTMRYAFRPSGTRWEDLRARSARFARGQHRSEAVYRGAATAANFARSHT